MALVHADRASAKGRDPERHYNMHISSRTVLSRANTSLKSV